MSLPTDLRLLGGPVSAIGLESPRPGLGLALGIGFGRAVPPVSWVSQSLRALHPPVFLWASSGSLMTTGSEALEGRLLPALLPALTRNR